MPKRYKRPFADEESLEPLPKRLAVGTGVSPEPAVVYTDGACSNNGKTTAAAGFGVYWGEGHKDNVSAPVTGEPTNNRAEYEAIQNYLLVLWIIG
uniref:ribonuclease H n=1 Tax=Panagrolaimus superbus TaxID=310955 RepID=A0A914Z6A9_9BILA